MGEPTYSSFAEQALHYFDRPHDSVRREPLYAPAAWRGSDMRSRDDWIVTLGSARTRSATWLSSSGRLMDRKVKSLSCWTRQPPE